MPAKKVTGNFTSAREALRPVAAANNNNKKPAWKKFDKPPVTSWSLSKIKQWEKCPLQFRGKHLEKISEPQGAAMARGDLIHKAIEAFLRFGTKIPVVNPEDAANGVYIHPSLKGFFAELRAQFKRRNLNAEAELAFDRQWTPTSWFDPRGGPPTVYVRMKADALLLPKDPKAGVYVYDWKTGKIRDDEYEDTVEIYAIAALSAGVGEQASGSLVYTDHGEFRENKKPIKLSELPKLQKKWDARVLPMMKDTRFAPRPGNHCRWCVLSRSKGGQCQY